MEKRVCHIVGAADFAPSRFDARPGDLVIACDAGLRALRDAGFEPDVILGDFDSLGEEPSGDRVIRHAVRKDDTDSFLAIEEAKKRGCRVFMLHGCSGGMRFDHTVANLQALAHIASTGGAGFMLAPDFTAAAAAGGTELVFAPGAAGEISVFAFGGECVISERGLDYPARDLTLTPTRPVGVSNAFTGREAAVAVRSGMALIVWRDVDAPLPVSINTVDKR